MIVIGEAEAVIRATSGELVESVREDSIVVEVSPRSLWQPPEHDVFMPNFQRGCDSEVRLLSDLLELHVA